MSSANISPHLLLSTFSLFEPISFFVGARFTTVIIISLTLFFFSLGCVALLNNDLPS